MPGDVNRDRFVKRFIKYTTYDTKSDPTVTDKTPSTEGQRELAKIIVADFKTAGYQNVEVDDQCYIYATLPSNIPDGHPAKGKVPVVGLFGHLDTASEESGKDVKARVIENYDGSEITYPANPDIKLTSKVAPELKDCIGHTIITSDGTTLLGGDDKVALSIMVELPTYFKENPEMLHGNIRVAVIPDEEIGVGTEKFDLKKFGADVAYTIDASEIGGIDVESFNGFKAGVEVKGVSAFPGYGKDIYQSAAQVISKFVAKMDEKYWPQNGADRDSIWWVDEFSASVSEAKMSVYMRAFDIEGIKEEEKMLNSIANDLLKEYPTAKINVDVKEMYKNYKYELDKDPRVVDYAEEAMKKLQITPKRNFVRGGNDSCHLCFSGLLSTNIFAGFHNMHSLREWVSVETMEASLKTVATLAGVWVEHA